MYISFGNIYEAFSGLATEHFYTYCFVTMWLAESVVVLYSNGFVKKQWIQSQLHQQWLGNEGGIKGFLNGSGHRKVPDIFIISVILCASSQIMSQMHSAFHTGEGCALLKPSYLMDSIPKS